MSGELTFARLDDANLAFCSMSQRLFSLNDIAAYVWCRLEERIDDAAIEAELVDRGIEREAASLYLADARRDRRAHAIEHDSKRDHDLDVAGVAIRLRLDSENTASAFARTLSQLESHRSGKASVLVEAMDCEGQGIVKVAGSPSWSGPLPMLPSALKAELLREALARSCFPLALHAATLAAGGKAILLVGPPGAGKTTLALGLAASGVALHGDDVALVDETGQVRGLPFAPAVKPGSYTLLASVLPALQETVPRPRPDGAVVRYLDGLARAQAHSLPVGWIVFVGRTADPWPQGRENPLRALEAFRRIIAGAHGPTGRMSDRAFIALTTLLSGARTIDLRGRPHVEAVAITLDAVQS